MSEVSDVSEDICPLCPALDVRGVSECPAGVRRVLGGYLARGADGFPECHRGLPRATVHIRWSGSAVSPVSHSDGVSSRGEFGE